MHKNIKKRTASLILFSLVLLVSNCFAGLAISPGVTTDILDDIDKVEDEMLREMLKAAVWPGFGERHMDLDRPDEELTPFERNYKQQPLTWSQKIENVEYILNQKEDPSELTQENVEYKDIVFGEAVIPVIDSRVVKINNTLYLSGEIERLDEEKQAAMAALYETGGEDLGLRLQQIEDEYATKLATLMQAEAKYKQAKIDFLKLNNQKKYGRIDDETYQRQTQAVVEEFESFFEIGSEVPVFEEEKIKQLGSSIYDESIIISESQSVESQVEPIPETNKKFYYWGLSVVFMLLALLLGYLGFKRIKKK